MFCLSLVTFQGICKTIFFAMCHDWTLCSIMSVDRDFHKCLEPRRINNPPPNLCRLDLKLDAPTAPARAPRTLLHLLLMQSPRSTRFVSLGPWEIFSVYASGLGISAHSPNTLIHLQSFKALSHSPSFSSAPFLPGLSVHLLPFCPLTLAPDGLGDSISINAFDCHFQESSLTWWGKIKRHLGTRTLGTAKLVKTFQDSV